MHGTQSLICLYIRVAFLESLFYDTFGSKTRFFLFWYKLFWMKMRLWRQLEGHNSSQLFLRLFLSLFVPLSHPCGFYCGHQCSWTVWPDWAIYWTLGKCLKPLATINLPKSPTFFGNFCKSVKIYHFSSEIILGNFCRLLAIFFWLHCSWTLTPANSKQGLILKRFLA